MPVTRLLVAAALGWILMQEPDDPDALIREYGALELDAKAKGQRDQVDFDEASRRRIDIELRLVKGGKGSSAALRQALRSENRHVRAMSANLLGVIGDAASIASLAEISTSDADPIVRSMAVQSLAWLGAPAKHLDAAEKDRNANVRFVVARAREQLKVRQNLAAAFEPLKTEDMAAAEVGKPAPDFALPTSDGKTWKLSAHKGTVVLMFQLADW